MRIQMELEDLDLLLEGKVALVAGVGPGVGGATARLLAAEGADVAAIDRSAGPAEAAIEAVKETGRRSHLEIADLRDPEAVKYAISRIVDDLGGIDILVTVAGGFTPFQAWKSFEDGTLAEWDEIVDLNLRYAVTLSREVLPHIRRRASGGAVVFVSSISAVSSAPRHASYGAAKAGLINFTRSLANEYGPRGVRVNAVAPGAIASESARSKLDADIANGLFETVPLGRPATPDEIAGAILFLVSPLAGYVTGHTLVADGGATTTFPFPS